MVKLASRAELHAIPHVQLVLQRVCRGLVRHERAQREGLAKVPPIGKRLCLRLVRHRLQAVHALAATGGDHDGAVGAHRGGRVGHAGQRKQLRGSCGPRRQGMQGSDLDVLLEACDAVGGGGCHCQGGLAPWERRPTGWLAVGACRGEHHRTMGKHQRTKMARQKTLHTKKDGDGIACEQQPLFVGQGQHAGLHAPGAKELGDHAAVDVEQAVPSGTW